MTDTNGNPAMPGDDPIEALLEKAVPRPAPPDSVEQDIRAAVHAEWAAVTKRRGRRRLAAGLAMAATVTLVLAVSLSGLHQAGVAPVDVAAIDKTVGTIYVQIGSSGEMEAVDTTRVRSGEILTTGADSAAGLTWLGGGSLRIASDSRIEFRGADEIFLHSGTVYFDSSGMTADADFSILSAHGAVSHVGTQFLTRSTAASLVVSVREGEVSIDGTYHDQTVHSGQRVEMTGSSRPTVTNTTGTGLEWQWVETVAPGISVDGLTVFEFLQWVAREIGHSLQFESDDAEALARNTLLKGTVNADPRTELRLRMMTVDLDARIDPQSAAIIVGD
jgi:hypothetical protein